VRTTSGCRRIVVAQHRQVTLRLLAAATDGYDVIAQNKWRAWRRKNKLDTDCHEDFANQGEGVLEFVDPIFTRLDLGAERIPLVIARRPYNRAQ